MENHHVAIEKHDSAVTVLLCRNCHSEVTENLRQSGRQHAVREQSGMACCQSCSMPYQFSWKHSSRPCAGGRTS